jgi:hypothetical protein
MSPFWDGWGIGQWAFFLGIPGLLVVALVIKAREPGWWSRVEEKYRQFQTQGDLYRERWTTRATNGLGANRVNKLYVVILVSFFAAVIQGYAVWGFGPERNGRDILVPAAITTLLAAPAYVCVLILDFSAFGKRLARPLLISWIVVPFAWTASVLIESFDETEGSTTALEGTLSAVVLFALASVFFGSRRVLRARLLREQNDEPPPPAEAL